MRALVVDDSPIIRKIMSRILIELGFEITQAANGRDALDQLREHGTHDVALIDWNMPEMNGLELIQEIRADHEHDDLPIIMVTTETEMERMSQAFEAGANEYVMKPFNQEVISEKLEMIGVGC